MRIINVVVCCENQVSSIDSFGVYDHQLSSDVAKEAEELFVKKIEEFIGEPLDDEDKERYLEDGYYEDGTKGYYYIGIVWSEINQF
jgi:hypothetical protein